MNSLKIHNNRFTAIVTNIDTSFSQAANQYFTTGTLKIYYRNELSDGYLRNESVIGIGFTAKESKVNMITESYSALEVMELARFTA